MGAGGGRLQTGSFSISPRQDNRCVPVHIPAKCRIPKRESKGPTGSQLCALGHGDTFTVLYIHGDANFTVRCCQGAPNRLRALGVGVRAVSVLPSGCCSSPAVAVSSSRASPRMKNLLFAVLLACGKCPGFTGPGWDLVWLAKETYKPRVFVHDSGFCLNFAISL